MTRTSEIDPCGRDADLFPDDRLATTGALIDAQMAVGAAIDHMAVDPTGLDPAMADLLVLPYNKFRE